MSDQYWMRQAFDAACVAAGQGEVPVGAVIIDGAERLVARASNAMIHQHDPSAHAEILALRQAAFEAGNYRLNNHSIYVTLEPCPMCAAALVQARIKRLVFASRDFKTGAAGTVFNLVNHPKLNHQIQVDEGILQEECTGLLQNFFAKRR